MRAFCFFLCFLAITYADIDWRPTAKFGPCSAVPLNNEKVVFATNAGALPYEAECGNISAVSGAMWFSVAVNQGETVDLTTIYPYTNFPTIISAFTGSCDNLQCETATTNGTLTLSPNTASLFYISVSGKNNTSGSFAFSAKKTNLQQQSACNDATEVYLNDQWNVVIVNNFPTENSDSQMLCDINTESTKVSWYKVFTPEINVLFVGDRSDNLELTVFTGTCDNLQRVPCDDDPTVAEYGYVAAAYNGEGTNPTEYKFEGNVRPVSISSCATATGFYLYGADSEDRTVSTLGQNVMSSDSCMVQESPVYWFNVSVTPSSYESGAYSLTFDTCSPYTEFDTLITVYSDSCSSLSCIEKKNTPCPNGENGSVTSVDIPVNGSYDKILYYATIGAADGKSSGNIVVTASTQYN